MRTGAERAGDSDGDDRPTELGLGEVIETYVASVGRRSPHQRIVKEPLVRVEHLQLQLRGVQEQAVEVLGGSTEVLNPFFEPTIKL